MTVADVALAALEAHHKDSAEHCRRVGERCAALARHLGMTAEEIWEAGAAGELHDLGKLAIHKRILAWPKPLGAVDWVTMHSHPTEGAQLLLTLDTAHSAGIAAAVRHHHERWDGHGYPSRLAGADIPLTARIVAICDSYDAMVSLRPWAAQKTVGQAKAELQAGAGTQWDPALVEAFLEL